MIKAPARAVVGAIDAAAVAWSDARFEPRIRARDAVALRTGYSPPMVDYAFDRLFGSLRRNSIERIIEDELGSLDVLDGFAQRCGRPRATALSIGRVCVVSSRTTIGVAIVPAVFAICAKCDVLVKDREDGLAGAFLETIAATLPEIRDTVAARPWNGDQDAGTLRNFDMVVAFGNNATLAKISANLVYPARMVGYGTKASAGYVARDALTGEDAARVIAEGAARDLILYESEGCLSLHALFVEEGGTIGTQEFARYVAAALHDAAGEFPSALRDPSTPARRAAARELAAFRGEQYFSDSGAQYLAVLDPPRTSPPFFLARTLGIHGVERPADAAEYLERHGIELEALAIAGNRSDLRELAVRMRAARVAAFGTLQAPPLGVFHGGRPRIAEFVRWIGDET
ncbi:MAG TPA: acyl-CoA reductase [Candidatus Cybelea sp.]|nr:acyl-CoA reductase [Candidatus Cybelea sp.]